MIIPLRTDSPLRRTPYMNYGLILANFIVFFIQVSYNAQQPGDSSFVRPLILQPAHPRIWQYVTYAFLHANLMHIGGNMLFLYIFGNNINDRLGNLGYLAFYLAGGIFAGLGYVLVEHQGTQAGILGASGAVAAVTGAYLILLPKSNITIFYFFFFIGVVEIASLWFILLFFLLDVIEQSTSSMIQAEPVAHVAHIAGTLFGASLSFILLWTRMLPRDQFDVVALVQRWNRRRQYRDMVSSGYNPFGYEPSAAGAGQLGGPAGQRGRAGAYVEPVVDARAQQLMDLRSRASEAVAGHDMPKAVEIYQELLDLDPNQVLSRGAQLDVANYLASQQQYARAAKAYEQFLHFYANYDQIEQVYLMLGVIYSRYLNQPQRAKEFLLRALGRLHFERDVALANAELAALAAYGAGPPGV